MAVVAWHAARGFADCAGGTAHISFHRAEFSGPWRRIAIALHGFRRPGGVRRPRCSGAGGYRDARPSGARILGHRDCMGVQRVGRARPPERNLQWPDRCSHKPWVAMGGVLYSNGSCAAAAHYARVDILDSVAAKTGLRVATGSATAARLTPLRSRIGSPCGRRRAEKQAPSWRRDPARPRRGENRLPGWWRAVNAESGFAME